MIDIYPTSHQVRFETSSLDVGGIYELKLMNGCHKKCLISSAFPTLGHLRGQVCANK